MKYLKSSQITVSFLSVVIASTVSFNTYFLAGRCSEVSIWFSDISTPHIQAKGCN